MARLVLQCGCTSGDGCGHGSVPMEPQPDLKNRVAKCTDCPKTLPSDPGFAFFVYQPSEPQDKFWCGCWGWGPDE